LRAAAASNISRLLSNPGISEAARTHTTGNNFTSSAGRQKAARRNNKKDLRQIALRKVRTSDGNGWRERDRRTRQMHLSSRQFTEEEGQQFFTRKKRKRRQRRGNRRKRDSSRRQFYVDAGITRKLRREPVNLAAPLIDVAPGTLKRPSIKYSRT